MNSARSKAQKRIALRQECCRPGRIVGVLSGPEDHGCLTCWVNIELPCGSQGFGGLALDESTLPAFVRDLCETFGVSNVDALKGLQVNALYCFDNMNERIEGLADPKSGRCFLITRWRKKMHPDVVVADRLTAERASLLRDVEYHLKRAEEIRKNMETLEERYVDWENSREYQS